MTISSKVLTASGLNPKEYERIVLLLGREPNLVELGIFSAMWSEHCSYKSSRVHLKNLPTTGERVVQGPGENAGVIDIGDDWCIVFKIESHNHPSFIEPFSGAATGVGGILRDIFTMGARPIAILNSLRFGPIENSKFSSRNKAILDGVVRGISHYGNAFGCPTVGGEVHFSECYSTNPLVNVFALGVVRKDSIFLGKASGVGNPVLYVGAKTGRDGIAGAVMASAEFDEDALSKRPAIQIGDPFGGKLLLEACLEAMRTDCIIGIQDMGAAGLTSSSCEMASRGETGIEIDLDLIPQREPGMTPYEILLSESQERMLIVSAVGREKELQEIFAKWDLSAVVIGRVTDDKIFRILEKGNVVAEIPNKFLTDEAPYYERPSIKPKINKTSTSLNRILPFSKRELTSKEVEASLNKLLTSPNLSSRKWIYEQYDYLVRTNTIIFPGADAAVLRVKETRKGLAISLDGNGRYCSLNPKGGAELIVAESCRNLVAVGATPVGITNCLNFASPERKEVMGQFEEVIQGMSEAARQFNIPIISGNVSFYNETDGKGIYPTPVIGSVGLIEDVRNCISMGSMSFGNEIFLLGNTYEELGGSEYLEQIIGKSIGPIPHLDYPTEQVLQSCVLEASRNKLLTGAHDVSDGGLLVAIAEFLFSVHNRSCLGAEISLTRKSQKLSVAGLLFGETPSRMLISVSQTNSETFKKLVSEYSVPYEKIGKITEKNLSVILDGSMLLDTLIHQLEEHWKHALEKLF